MVDIWRTNLLGPAKSVRPTSKIFLLPLTQPCFTRMGRSGFFLTYQIGYPLNLIVYSKTCIKRPLKKQQSLFFQDRLSHNAGQKVCRMIPGSILQYWEHSAILGAFCNTFNLHLVPICLNDLCCVYLKQVLLNSPTICNKIKYTNNLLT